MTAEREIDGAPAPGAAEDAAEAEAWAAVLAAWEDDGRHRAYLDGLRGLDALALAGGRYRAVLEARPADAVALRWRDEVVRRATVAGLATLPRAAPELSRLARRVRIVAFALVIPLLVALLVAGARLAFTALSARGSP